MTEKFIKSGIIQPGELNQLLISGAAVRLVDATYAMPGNPPPLEGYKQARIGDAVFFDIEKIADHASPLPHMLPKEEDFAKAVSALGISNSDFVVVYGRSGTIMGPARVWWTFRAFGHENICVLDGGLPAWVKAGLPVNTNPPAIPSPKPFKATLQTNLVRSLKDMQKASETSSALICDARPESRFSGQAPEPRPGMRSGHIPSSFNIPATVLVNPETGLLRPDSELEKIFKTAGYKKEKPVYATCGSGVTACMIALAAHKIGITGVSVYDGAWSEWGAASSGMKVSGL